MKKVKLSDCQPWQKVRMKPNSKTLEVHQHLHGLTRVLLDGEGFWRDSKDEVYIENQ